MEDFRALLGNTLHKRSVKGATRFSIRLCHQFPVFADQTLHQYILQQAVHFRVDVP